MPLYRYYFSASPGDPSPVDGKLFLQEAESTSAAVEELIRQGQLPPNWQSMWIHFLVWVDQEGQQRGFESIRLCEVLHG
jgi:hypothetical protein